MILLSSSLTVRRSTVGVPQSLGYTIRFPPTVRRVRYRSLFSGRYSTTTRPYVMCFHLSVGTSALSMKKNGVSPFDDIWDDLRESSEFFSVGVLVEVPILGNFHELLVFHDFPCFLIEDGVEHLKGETAASKVCRG